MHNGGRCNISAIHLTNFKPRTISIAVKTEPTILVKGHLRLPLWECAADPDEQPILDISIIPFNGGESDHLGDYKDGMPDGKLGRTTDTDRL